MYDRKLKFRGRVFEVEDIEQRFGKTTVLAYMEDDCDTEEIFYIEEQYLSEPICEELYEKYLYVYGDIVK